MVVKRLLGGLVFAVVVAIVLEKTVGAVYMQCLDWWACWPF